MFTIEEKVENGVITAYLKGELDSVSVLGAEPILCNLVDKSSNIVLDCTDMEYIASSGLRVLLMLQKQVKSINGSLVLVHVHPDVMDTLKVTGFVRLLTIR